MLAWEGKCRDVPRGVGQFGDEFSLVSVELPCHVMQGKHGGTYFARVNVERVVHAPDLMDVP